MYCSRPLLTHTKMTMPINTSRSGLARSLAASSLLLPDELDQALALARQEGKPFSTVLVEQRLLTSTALARFCEQEYGLPLIDLNDFNLDQVPPQFISMDLIERHHVILIYLQGKVLYLAMSDPTNVAALEDFSFRFNLVTDALLVEEDKLQQMLSRLQQGGSSGVLDLENIADDDIAGLELAETGGERDPDLERDDD